MANKTTVERFTNNSATTTTTTSDDLSNFGELEQQLNYLMGQYTQLQQTISTNSLANISRTGTNNPWRNSMISANGAIGNVTGQGMYKWFDSWATIDATQGKNGCPASTNITPISQTINTPNQPGEVIQSNPNLLVGTPMKSGQSCGSEGSNVYASRLIDSPSSNYIGCYNDTDSNQTMVSVVPVLTANSSSSTNYVASQSSAYTNNESTYGAWAAFDQNPQTYWHSNTLYNQATGAYQGSATANGVKGEYIRIDMPSAIKVLQYSIAPRLDVITIRSPNSWYLFGYKSGQWTQLDRQVSQQFVSSSARRYVISNPDSYTYYLMVIDIVGNSDVNSNKDSVQIAELTLYANRSTSGLTSLSSIDSNSGYMSYNQCQQYALDNGYTYFGLQDYQGNGKGLCGVGNDISKIRGYGTADSQATASPIWASNTAGNPIKRMELRVDGSITLVDTTDGTVYWSSPSKPSDCVKGGYVNPDTISGSYGGNCVGKPRGVDCNNPSSSESYSSQGIIGNITSLLTTKAQNAVSSSNASWSYNPLTDWTGGDPAYCCNKTVDYSYQCGSGPFKSGRQNGGSLAFDCSREVANCVFFLVLQDDGNMCIYRGQDPSNNKGGVWCSATNGKQKNPNSQWVAANSKYGRNYLKSGETLLPGEWLGSSDGSLRLVMQQDGNLVLYTSIVRSGCQRDNSSGKTFGTANVNAVYQLSSTGNKASLGKVGYVDADSNLHEYPDSMLTMSNDYTIIQGYNSGGNDISSQQADNLDGCKVACNNSADCAGIVYQESTKTCWLKNKGMYPKGDKQPSPGLTLGVRKPVLKTDVNCSRSTNEIDTVRYDNYVKGAAMDYTFKCDAPVVNTEQKSQLDSLGSQIQVLGQQLASKMNELYVKDNKIYEKMNMNETQFKNNLRKYQSITALLENEKKSAGIVEGMSNLSDINGQLLDTNLRVLQENYSYIFWSLLALGAITVTVSTMKK